MPVQPFRDGRPPIISDDLIKKIVAAIKAGNYMETAAAYAGINKSTLYAWLKRGERTYRAALEDAEKTGDPNIVPAIPEDDQIYVDFSRQVEQALAYAEVRDVMIITKAAEENWQAAAWRLERKFPGRWGRQRIEITGKDGAAIESESRTEHVVSLEEEIRKYLPVLKEVLETRTVIDAEYEIKDKPPEVIDIKPEELFDPPPPEVDEKKIDS